MYAKNFSCFVGSEPLTLKLFITACHEKMKWLQKQAKALSRCNIICNAWPETVDTGASIRVQVGCRCPIQQTLERRIQGFIVFISSKFYFYKHLLSCHAPKSWLINMPWMNPDKYDASQVLKGDEKN